MHQLLVPYVMCSSPYPQLFISELYAYLLDQMHAGMSQVLSLESPPEALPSFTSTALLRLFASEAEVYGDLTLADHYHRQVHTYVHMHMHPVTMVTGFIS